MLAFIADILKSLKPSTDDDPRLQYAWRQAVFYALVGVIFVCGFSFAWAQGLIPHLSGVALAEDVTKLNNRIGELSSKADVQNLKREVTSLRNAVTIGNVQAADAAIVEQETILCRAISTNNSLAANFASRQIQVALANYYALTGHDYFHIPTCTELGITPKSK